MEQNQTNLTKKKQIRWITIVIVIGSLILILAGFILGYFYAKPCSQNPLVFGIKQINEEWQEDYECVCKSRINFNSFSFDSEKIQDTILIP